MKPEYIKIGRYLKEKRESLGLSQQDVADYVGVSKSGVSRWESGETSNIGRLKIQLLSEILKVSPLSIIYGENRDSDAEEISTSELSKYFNENKDKLSTLEKDDQDKLIEIIDLYLK